jgi:hypothetical protein
MVKAPPGTSKSAILRAITSGWGVPLLFTAGNCEHTRARLVDHHAA